MIKIKIIVKKRHQQNNNKDNNNNNNNKSISKLNAKELHPQSRYSALCRLNRNNFLPLVLFKAGSQIGVFGFGFYSVI